MDLRSVKQSEVARAKGGGIEPETHYTLWKKINKPVDFSSDSYSKFIEGEAKNSLGTSQPHGSDGGDPRQCLRP